MDTDSTVAPILQAFVALLFASFSTLPKICAVIFVDQGLLHLGNLTCAKLRI